tara:strand:+ start:840 stop:1046 length:207 start_codon:yes stop_codon:yes gene_type:complete
MSIDLELLRRSAFSDSKENAVVTRAFLRQVHDELSAGRVAQAQLRRAGSMDDVVQGLRTGPIERTSTL